MEGAPKFAESQTLPDVDFAAFARSLGLDGDQRRRPGRASGRAWDAALRRRPADRARRPLRSRRPADSAARDVRPGQSRRQARCCTATRTAGASSSRASSRRSSSTCPARRKLTRCRQQGPGRPGLVSERCRTSAPAGSSGSLSALTAGGRGDHRRGDLHLARRRQLRQQDDVVAGGRRADRDPGRDRGGLLRAGGEDRAAAGIALPSSPTGCRAPTCTGAASRSGPAAGPGTTSRVGPPVFAPLLAVLVGGMGLLAAVLRREDRASRRGRLMPYRSPDQRAVTPQDRGRFPGFDVLDQVERWDDVTAGVVLARLAPPTDLSFFTSAERGDRRSRCSTCCSARTASRECRCWPDRHPAGHRRDRRLALRRHAGGRRRPGGRRWPLLDEDAASTHSAAPLRRSSAAASRPQLIQAVQDLATRASSGTSCRPRSVWSLWTRYACTAFYSHPWAWNEIGFGGPAYPRGYLNLGVDAREHWEVADQHADRPGAVRSTGSSSAHATTPTLLGTGARHDDS